MPFPAYLQFSLSSSELFLTSRWYKQTSWVPIRCSLVLHLFNDSCFQKRSQPHSWLSVPAVPSALDLAEVVGQIWWKTTSVKTATKSHSLPVPSDSPVVGFSPGKGRGHSPCPLTSGRYHRRCFHLQCLRDVLIKKKKSVDLSFYFC